MTRLGTNRSPFPANVVFYAVLCLTTQAWTMAASDPWASAPLYVAKYYDADGLPQNSVESMSLASSGLLWVTTRDGGAVFDGNDWTAVSMPEPSTSNWPRVVLTASDGAVFFGIEPEGLARLDNGAWHLWQGPSQISGQVRSMAENNGVVLVATSKGIYAMRPESANPVMELGETDVRAVATGGRRTIAITSKGEFLRRGATGWSGMSLAPVAAGGPISILVRDDRIVVGTNAGIVTIENGSTRFDDLGGKPVSALAETIGPDDSRTTWAGTEGGGLFHRSEGSWQRAAPTIAVPNRYVFSLVASPPTGRTENLFVGTLSGVGRIDLVSWRHIGVDEGLPDPSVVSLMESRTVSPGTFFIGTTEGLAVFGSSGKWEPHPCEELFVPVFSMLESESRNALLFGTDEGVVVLENGRCRRLPGFGSTSIATMVETGTEPRRLWVGRWGDGVSSLGDDGTWTPLPHELPDKRIEALVTSGKTNDVLWIATNRGLARVSGDDFAHYDSSSGLPNDLVRSLLVHDGKLWVGTADGLAFTSLDARPPAWSVVDLRADGRMQNATVYRIEADRSGTIYAFTGRGVARLERSPDTGQYHVGRVFLAEDGLPSNETNFGASMVDSKGRIWVGTPRGAGIFDPDLEGSEHASPNLLVSLKTEPFDEPIRDGMVVSYDAERIVAHYRLIDLVHGRRAAYRTRLIGLDDEPSNWTTSTVRTFTKLRGGRYELRVWSRDPHGHDAGPVSMSFYVQPPPWLSWWAVLLYVAVGVLILYTFVGLRIRALRQRNQDLELIVRSRTRDLEVANRQLESANITLADMSVTDPLTGAKNRRFLLQIMEQEAVRIRRSTREADDIVFILVDIDRFKHLNDRFGHATGDLVLKQFYRVLQKAVRDSDTIVRWGGEEFLIVARKISRSEAEALVDRILHLVREERFASMDNARHLRLTCSIGFAAFPFVTWDRSLFTWEQVVDIADHCLYAVKRSGRDGWVGLAPGSELRADSFLARMRDDVGSMMSVNEVIVTTSFGSAYQLVWR